MTAAFEQFSALIIDNRAQARAYLWEAILADPHFSRVSAVKELEEAQALFFDRFQADVVLLSSGFDSKKIRNFIEAIRTTEGGKEVAIVSVVRAVDQENSSLGQFLADGADGFLLVPFSVVSVGQVAEIAKRVKHEFDRKRRGAAATLLSIDLLGKFDALSRKFFMTGDIKGKAYESFAALSDQIRDVIQGETDIAAEAVRARLRATEAPRVTLYQGPSQRLKKKLADGE
jgi:CheY-like chemotaxis protein